MKIEKDIPADHVCLKEKEARALELCDPQDEFEMLQKCKICQRIL